MLLTDFRTRKAECSLNVGISEPGPIESRFLRMSLTEALRISAWNPSSSMDDAREESGAECKKDEEALSRGLRGL